MKGQLDVTTPEEYVASLDEPRKSDVGFLLDFIRKAVPSMECSIQSGMIGFGRYTYRYATGRSGESMKIGLASNANYISVYAAGFCEQGYIAELNKDRIGKASVGKSCIRFKRVSDIDLDVLKEILLVCEKMESFDLYKK